ncbi:MAG: nucleoside hydrolase [Candidatus Eisenbacteria bacterium]|nr:nucleoside hydrolase [Candidatus Eisenbacteria bacterium]
MTNTPERIHSIVLDVDTGVDDAVAIAMALNSPELEILAITTVAGNAAVDLCTRNSLVVTELLGSDVPVARGAASPLSKDLLTAPEVHGEDGLGGRRGSLPEPLRAAVAEPAHELLLRVSREHPGEVTLVTTGPLTNLAIALASDPDGLAGFARIVSMGGAFRVPGNTGEGREGPVAEFNVYVDPEAASAVLSSGLEITLVPLDATTQAILPRSSLQGRERTSRAPLTSPGRDVSAILYRALDYYMGYQLRESGLDGGFMHDPLAVASVARPELLRTRAAGVAVVIDGPERGRTIEDAAALGRGVHVAIGHQRSLFRQLTEDWAMRPVFGSPI